VPDDALRIGCLRSVNVGEPRTVAWAGRRVRTAIWKAPAPGRVTMAGINLAGDAQADLRVHGGPDKAVYAYAIEDYQWWEGELSTELAPGTFGENLTTAGIDLSAAVIGERWAVGTAIVEVAQPRSPCFKLGIRMGDDGFVERFEAARRYGAYLRIVTGGDVGEGDDLTLVSRPAHGLTTAFVADVKATPDRHRVELLRACDDMPASVHAWAERQLGRG